MPKRAAPIEYLLDMYVDGRLEDAANEEHLPGAGSVKEQANAAAVKLCHTLARHGGSGDFSVVVSPYYRRDFSASPIAAMACCFERGADGRRTANPRSVKPPRQPSKGYSALEWAPPASACRR